MLTTRMIDNGSWDNTGVYSLVLDRSTLTCADLGENTITLTVSDRFGNQSTCHSIVTVEDHTAPFLQDVDDIMVELSAGDCEATIVYPEILVDETCEVFLTLLSGNGPDAGFPVGRTVEVWEAKDKSGNADTLSFDVVVLGSPSILVIDSIADVYVDNDSSQVAVILSGISANGCYPGSITIEASSTNEQLIGSMNVEYANFSSGGTLFIDIVGTERDSAQVLLTFTSSDGGTSQMSFMVYYTDSNQSPRLIDSLSDRVVSVDSLAVLGLELLFEDPDGDLMELALFEETSLSLPSWVYLADDTLWIQPGIEDLGCYRFVVTATDVYGAVASETFELCVVDSVVGVPLSDNPLIGVHMYPNPSAGLVNLDLSGVVYDTEVWVMDIGGRLVTKGKYQFTDKIQIDMSEAVSGMYFIHLNLDGQLITKKLIVDKK